MIELTGKMLFNRGILKRGDMKIITTLIIFCFITGFSVSYVDAAQTGSLGTQQEEEMLTEDMGVKLGQAIAVLQAVQGEMKNLAKEEYVLKKQDDPSATNEEKAASLGKKVNALIQIWQKVTKSIKEKSGAPASDTTEVDGEQLKKDISNKLDAAMKTMVAIKKEMDKTE